MGAMSEVTAASPRRSSRVFHKMRVEVQGRAHNRKKFKETCETVVVNGHGGLLMLKHEVGIQRHLADSRFLTRSLRHLGR